MTMKKFLAAIGFCLVSILWPQLHAQAHTGMLALGMSMDEVERDLGSPKGYSLLNHIYARIPEVTGGYPLYHVYGRRTAHNEYEILILYKSDASVSRLHPKLRIEEMRFEFDKALPMDEVLGDLPEVSVACLSGCHVIINNVLGEIWLATNADGTGTVVTGSMVDSASGHSIPVRPPDLTVSQIVIWTSGTSLPRGMAHDTGNVWRPTQR